jgi:hypothetical protein
MDAVDHDHDGIDVRSLIYCVGDARYVAISAETNKIGICIIIEGVYQYLNTF